MKIFYAADIHAAETTFRKFTNAGPFYKVDLVIYGGDFCGKMVVPIVNKGNGRYEATYYGSTVSLKGDKEIPDLKKTLRDAGFYFADLTEAQLEKITEKDVERITKEEQLRRVDEWVDLMDQRFKKNNIPCIVIPGNDDPFYIDESLNRLSYVQNGDGKVLNVNGFDVISLSYAHPTIFKYPRDISEEELGKKIDELAAQVKDMNKCIFNIHVPPYDTDLDQDTLYDEDLNPILDGDALASGATGSKAVRAAIEKYQPMLSLHGHVHGSRGLSTIGKTVCINPGSEYDQALLKGALIEVNSNGQVLSHMLTAG